MSYASDSLARPGLFVAHRVIALRAGLRWHHLALIGILLVGAALRLFQLEREGYSNLYYAATVRSMLTSWHAFFFASYDPGGFVTVDKPPLGFWAQAASAALLGYSGFSVLLPQIAAGIASMAVLYRLVARDFGVVAGLIAALVLAVMPISVATDRSNTPDALLVLLLLLAAWAVLRAAERGSLRWLLVAAVLVGLGFNVKMLQAYLVLPALWLTYLVAAPLRRRVRLAHLAFATAVLLVVSFSWAVIVDLTPPDRRPYVGGSRSNSVIELALGYNGLARLFGMSDGVGLAAPAPGTAPAAGDKGGGAQYGVTAGRPAAADGGGAVAGGGGAVASIGGETGEPGPLRLFSQQLAGQVSWLLPLGVAGAAVAAWRSRRDIAARGLGREGRSLLVWGTWFLVGAAFFSVAAFWHPYYLVVLAPAVAALVGIGVVGLWRAYRRRTRVGLLLPLALAGTALAQVAFLAPYADWSSRLTPLILAATLPAAVVLLVVRLLGRHRIDRRRLRLALVAAAVAVAGLLLAPGAWSAITSATARGDTLPAAGPGVPGLPHGGPSAAFGDADPDLIRYLLSNRRDERFLVATEDSSTASPIIIDSAQPVMALGGFGGRDRIMDRDALARAVRDGIVRYFLFTGGDREPTAGGATPSGAGAGTITIGPAEPQDDVRSWVRENCRRVPESAWRAGRDRSTAANTSEAADSTTSSFELWDCGARRS